MSYDPPRGKMAGEKKDKISNYGRKYKWFKIVRGDLALTLRSMKIKDNFFFKCLYPVGYIPVV